MAIRLIRPPIRTALMNNPDGTPMNQIPASDGSGSPAKSSPDGGQITIQKSWYRYWGDCGDQTNANTDKLDNLVTFGTHANRPDPANMPNGALYFESDRNVIYGNINGTWHYVAGTMWGTFSPDQRPADLGANDAGFDFRTTDDPAREFIWSQAQWIEATPVRYGTHAQRLAVVGANVIDQMLWVETDRGDVTYQMQAHAWHYIAGTMYGTMSPDQRPTDLGANDIQFPYRATDTRQTFYWSGSAWVETTPATGSVQIAYASAALTLTTTLQTIPGTTLVLPKAGTYLIVGVFYFSIAAADQGNTLLGTFSGGTGIYAVFNLTGAGINGTATVTQQWVYHANAGDSVYLEASKSGGTGGSLVFNSHTSISATWVST